MRGGGAPRACDSLFRLFGDAGIRFAGRARGAGSLPLRFTHAVDAGHDAVNADFQFHHEITRATQNPHFANLLATLGTTIIPRARLDPSLPAGAERQAYLRRVNAEHGSFLDAIANQDVEAARAAMRTHLANSRERRRRAASLAAEAS